MSKTLAIRVPPDVVERIDAYRAQLSAQNPAGVELTTSDVGRVLLIAGLDAVEARRTPSKSR